MNHFKVLDVTLRDGGCVNNFNFGQLYMDKILSALEQSGVDIIEVGYLDQNKGSVSERTQYINESAIINSILKSKKKNKMYVAMIDYGKYDIDKLQPATADNIDAIRLAFHKENKKDMIALGRKIIDKGYRLFIQPMVTLRYSDSELLELINLVNDNLQDADCFYIVDSFGEMRPDDMSRLLYLVDHNLLPTMPLGFHSHNNLQLSYSNAMAMLQFPINRDAIIDSSVMGMGKGAGNLNTELLLEHLNLFYGKQYCIEPLLEVMDKVVNQLYNEYRWGYSPEYYLSSTKHCTPSYASYYYNKHMLPIDQVAELLGMIKEEKRISFDVNYAEDLYRKYNERKEIDDSSVLAELKSELKGKKVLLIAPGKSIGIYNETISEIIENEDVFSIGLNITADFKIDYLLATRQDVYEIGVNKGISVIAPSNVSKGGRGNVKILNYENWIDYDDATYDSSADIALNLLDFCEVKEIMFAGFDGFSVDINQNYADPYLRRPIDTLQAERRNDHNKKIICEKRKRGIRISFITPTKYQ